jgi:uncharacterized protein (DUF488 family)
MLHTIGFTKQTAAGFFGVLRSSGVRRVLDVRLNRTSQLAGFAKEVDLRFFLEELAGIDFVVLDQLAPTPELLAAYRSKAIGWDEYAKLYEALLVARRVEESVSEDVLVGGCLLCSEHTADRCHRRIAAEYLVERLGGWDIVHL